MPLGGPSEGRPTLQKGRIAPARKAKRRREGIVFGRQPSPGSMPSMPLGMHYLGDRMMGAKPYTTYTKPRRGVEPGGRPFRRPPTRPKL